MERPHSDRQTRTGQILAIVLGFAALALGALLTLTHEARRVAEARANTALEDVAEKTRALDAVKREQAEQKGALERLERENGELIELKTKLSLDVAAKEEELARLKNTYLQLEERMAKEIERGDIKLTQIGGRLQVDLVDKVLFDSGEAVISKRGEEVLARVGTILATIDDKQIQVSGHTDDSPPTDKIADRFPTNWELSAARATNVVRFLEDNSKVPGRRLVASGHGQYRPVSTNATPIGRARNRRIEILLIPLIEPVPRAARAGAK
jgi:chemotaxis protein MotB